ncbi:efflux RND transporter permease subunit [Candidatus Marinimicrobia bacterium MT.SAG.4]|nr:efflux RND transporter permease subunit [Candidatus Marinimicrobia bacterium MT.SAG.4]
MKGLIRYFAERHLLANLLVVVILIVGIGSALTIKRDVFPSVDMDQLMITTRYPGASPEDVELNVTNPLETELSGVEGIDLMTSYSMENISVISINIDSDVDDNEKVKRDIRDAVNRVTKFPPEVSESPYIFEITTDNMEIIWIGVAGDVPYSKLREYARQFRKKLENVKGVSRVDEKGLHDREIKVEVSTKAIEEYQIPLRDLVSAIQGRNIRATGGSFESYTSDKSIVTMAQFRSPEEVGEVIVRSTFEGPHILVKDLATIYDGFEPEKVRFRMNGKPAIGFTVFKKVNSDIIRVTDSILQLMEDERDKVPQGIELLYASEQSRFVKNRLNILANNGVIGLILVSIVLVLFLNFTTAFWVAMGIPLAMMSVVFLAPMFGVAIELISLMGMVIVIGLIVDDAIVIAENIHRHREKGKSPLDSAVDGAYGVLKPVFATIITTTLAFGTMFFMSGIMGKFIVSIPIVIILALGVSFFESLIILPSHIMKGMEKREKKRLAKTGSADNPKLKTDWFYRVREKFQRFMAITLGYRYLVFLVFIVLLVGAFAFAYLHMNFILFPGNTAENFFITVELPTGSSLDATEDKIKEIEAILQALPEDEMQSHMAILGSLGGGGIFTPGESENWAFILITLTPYNARNRDAEMIVADLREQTDKLEGFDAVRYIIDVGGPPVGRPIAIRVIGGDDAMRTTLADSVTAYLASIEGVTDIDRDDKLGKEQVEIKIDYPRLSELGLTVADIAQNVRLAYDGQVVTRVRYGDEDVGFRVILEESIRNKPDYLSELKIPNRRGRLIQLKEVAQFEIGPGPSRYFHYEKERTITVTADIALGDLTPLQATQMAVDHFDLTSDWPGMRFVIGGEAEETQESIVSLGITMLTAVVAIYFVLILLFNSVTQPLLVIIAIPFGLIGVIGAFAMHGEPLGFLAMMGVIGLMGVVVNDSLILVNYINIHRESEPEKKIKRIVAEGTATRLRPIILTSITTIAGVLPLAYGLGGSDPFLAPMALALGYGILFATPLTLILLPSLYMILDDIGRGIGLLKRLVIKD